MIRFRNYMYIRKKSKCMRGTKVFYKGKPFWYLGSFHVLGRWRHMLMAENMYEPELQLVEDVMLFSLPDEELPYDMEKLWEE